MQVHFTVASQFYVYVNVELYVHTFMRLYGGEKTGMLKFLLIFFHCVRGCWREMPFYTLLKFAEKMFPSIFSRKSRQQKVFVLSVRGEIHSSFAKISTKKNFRIFHYFKYMGPESSKNWVVTKSEEKFEQKNMSVK